jgi:hypothetical protein
MKSLARVVADYDKATNHRRQYLAWKRSLTRTRAPKSAKPWTPPPEGVVFSAWTTTKAGKLRGYYYFDSKG